MIKIIDRNIINDIKQVINNLRVKGVILSIIDNFNGTYTVNVNSTFDLVNGDYVTIENTTNFNSDKWFISNTTATSYDITAKTVFLTEAGTFFGNKPNFLQGRFLTIANQLLEMSNSEYKLQKYPAIILNTDFNSNINKEYQIEGYSTQNVNLYFVYQSNLTKGLNNEQWQYDNVINTILIPLKEKFFDFAEKSRYFTNDKNWHLNYTQKIYPNWGVAIKNGNGANILPDWLACIEVNFEITNKKIIL